MSEYEDMIGTRVRFLYTHDTGVVVKIEDFRAIAPHHIWVTIADDRTGRLLHALMRDCDPCDEFKAR